MKDKLRLLLFEECNRKCPGCCNNDWDLKNLEVCTDFSPYRLVMLTGGEPMLHPDVIRSAVKDIRAQSDAKIYLYTAMTDGLDEILPIIDGLTLTLHNPKDKMNLRWFELSSKNLIDLSQRGSLRLNIFREAGKMPDVSDIWKVKSDMVWIPDCPLPTGEVLMRYHK